MHNFKEGNWVIGKDVCNKPKEYTPIAKLKEIRSLTQFAWPYILDDGSYCAKVELWQPKKDEYLWDKQFGLSLVITNSHKGVVQCKAIFGYKETFFAKYNKNCQPFIGRIPTF